MKNPEQPQTGDKKPTNNQSPHPIRFTQSDTAKHGHSNSQQQHDHISININSTYSDLKQQLLSSDLPDSDIGDVSTNFEWPWIGDVVLRGGALIGSSSFRSKLYFYFLLLLSVWVVITVCVGDIYFLHQHRTNFSKAAGFGDIVFLTMVVINGVFNLFCLVFFRFYILPSQVLRGVLSVIRKHGWNHEHRKIITVMIGYFIVFAILTVLTTFFYYSSFAQTPFSIIMMTF